MAITIHIISNNYTNYKQTKIYEKINNIEELIDYINKYNLIKIADFNIYYNNQQMTNLPDLDDFSIIIRENKIYKPYKPCCINKSRL